MDTNVRVVKVLTNPYEDTYQHQVRIEGRWVCLKSETVACEATKTRLPISHYGPGYVRTKRVKTAPAPPPCAEVTRTADALYNW